MQSASQTEHQLSDLTVSLFSILLTNSKQDAALLGVLSQLSPPYLYGLPCLLSLSISWACPKVWALLCFSLWPLATLRSTSTAPMVSAITWALLPPTWTSPPECQSQGSKFVPNICTWSYSYLKLNTLTSKRIISLPCLKASPSSQPTHQKSSDHLPLPIHCHLPSIPHPYPSPHDLSLTSHPTLISKFRPSWHHTKSLNWSPISRPLILPPCFCQKHLSSQV